MYKSGRHKNKKPHWNLEETALEYGRNRTGIWKKPHWNLEVHRGSLQQIIE
jgi:hypothetical protein